MPRIARIVVPGWAHHVTQRGNHRANVFFCDHDREVYLGMWSKYAQLAHAELVGFALMDNHVHLVVIPEFETSLAKAVGRTDNDYARWQNAQCYRTIVRDTSGRRVSILARSRQPRSGTCSHMSN